LFHASSALAIAASASSVSVMCVFYSIFLSIASSFDIKNDLFLGEGFSQSFCFFA
jgi:hypothetical protein